MKDILPEDIISFALPFRARGARELRMRVEGPRKKIGTTLHIMIYHRDASSASFARRSHRRPPLN